MIEQTPTPGGDPVSDCDRKCSSGMIGLESIVYTGRIKIDVARLALAIPLSGAANSEC
jgi:hypothetical protein